MGFRYWKERLLAVGTAFNLASTALASLPLDLSEKFENAPLHNNNSGAADMIALAEENSVILGFMVIEEGEVVAEYNRDSDVGDNGASGDIYSCTKTWTSLLYAIMEFDGTIDLSERLADIIADDRFWSKVRNGENRKQLRIEQIITMTAGLQLGSQFISDLLFGRPTGGNSPLDSIEYHDLNVNNVDTFEYVAVGNIFSYILQYLTNKTPQEFADDRVFPYLGINPAIDVVWEETNDGVGLAWHGLNMNTHSMAKLGQLHLQNGFVNGETQIIKDDWVERATAGTEASAEYGYSWWNIEVAHCAIGLGGQYICFDPSGSNRVFVLLQRDMGEKPEITSALIDLAFGSSFSEPISEAGGRRLVNTEDGSSFRSILEKTVYASEQEKKAFSENIHQ